MERTGVGKWGLFVLFETLTIHVRARVAVCLIVAVASTSLASRRIVTHPFIIFLFFLFLLLLLFIGWCIRIIHCHNTATDKVIAPTIETEV